MKLIVHYCAVCVVVSVTVILITAQGIISWNSRDLVMPADTFSSNVNRDTIPGFPAERTNSSDLYVSQSHTDLPRPFNSTQLLGKLQHILSLSSLRSTEEILSSEWVGNLTQMLGEPKAGKQVSVVFATYSYLKSVLNWLIAAQVRLEPPLTDVIVFCLDKRIFEFLSKREIPSIYIDPQAVVKEDKSRTRFSHIWITRLVVYRLINYFGHDVMAIDSDAIVLRNPLELLELYKSSDIIGSAGIYPEGLGHAWGFTICMGVALF